MTTLPSADTMYRALLRRDRSYDGVFFVGVRTTGVFCRPVCPARKPKRENVEFFASSERAARAGYRPCRKCRPTAAGERPPAWAEQLLEALEREPERRLRDADLERMGIAPSRARRWFREAFGMTFQSYHRARRMGLALAGIRQGDAAAGAGFDLGFESLSGFRDAFQRQFGSPPGRAQDVGLLHARWLGTPLGPMLAVAGEDGLCLLEFGDRRALATELAELRRRHGAAIVPGRNAHLETVERELASYFAGELTSFTVAVDVHGTPFETLVWNELRRIPFGRTRSYTELARAVDRPGAQRAVGRANGHNPVAIVVPCHRVVRADGTLCGYGGGVWRKRRLLELEQRAIASAGARE